MTAALQPSPSRPAPGEDPLAGADVQVWLGQLHTCGMDVAISALRAELATWIERARAGEEVIVTNRGTPVARLLSVDTAPLLDQLTQRGVVSRPRRSGRPTASGARACTPAARWPSW